jgi:hypothetical protein
VTGRIALRSGRSRRCSFPPKKNRGGEFARQTISSEPSRLDIRGYAGFEDVGGFSAQTIASDGDRIEVLLLMDEPAFPGPAVIGKVIKTAELMRSDGQQCAQSGRTSHG